LPGHRPMTAVRGFAKAIVIGDDRFEVVAVR
jgi:hypothetical protein